MKKKIVLALLIVTLTAGGAFAQVAMSAGGGAFLGGDFGGGFKLSASAGGNTAEFGVKMPYFGGGIYGFFDATYAEVTVGLFWGKADWKGYAEINGQSDDTMDDISASISFTNFNLGLFGKYPIGLGAMTIFPMIGIDYCLTTGGTNEAGAKLIDADKLSALWIKAGCGFDFGLGDSLFLRAEALYGIRLANELEGDLADIYKAGLGGTGIDVATRLGHGLDIKLAIGFKF